MLIADDADTIRTLLTIALESEGYEVLTSTNGVETFEVGSQLELDLVILDQLMPGLLGLEIMDKWKSEGLDIPVIMLSGVDDENIVIESLEKGALDFIRKPFQIRELVARVKSAIGS